MVRAFVRHPSQPIDPMVVAAEFDEAIAIQLHSGVATIEPREFELSRPRSMTRTFPPINPDAGIIDISFFAMRREDSSSELAQTGRHASLIV